MSSARKTRPDHGRPDTGRDLRAIREACGVTMGDLAAELDIGLTAVSDRERGGLIDEHEVAAYVNALAWIVRDRTPVVTLNPDGAR